MALEEDCLLIAFICLISIIEKTKNEYTLNIDKISERTNKDDMLACACMRINTLLVKNPSNRPQYYDIIAKIDEIAAMIKANHFNEMVISESHKSLQGIMNSAPFACNLYILKPNNMHFLVQSLTNIDDQIITSTLSTLYLLFHHSAYSMVYQLPEIIHKVKGSPNFKGQPYRLRPGHQAQGNQYI
jgi:hypothetical protein